MTDEAQSGGAQPTAAALVIGDEILSGRTRDVNAHHLAGVLTGLGVRLAEARFVPDEAETISAAVRSLSAAYDYVFTSGGIGPTHDDITADAVAAAFGAAIGVRADARAILEAHYGEGGINEARLRMARIPDGALLIENPVSRAPGFQLGNVYVMAGVPAIFEAMLASVAPGIVGGPPMLSHSFRAPIPEGEIAAALGGLAAAHPAVSIGVYPFYKAGLGSTVVARSTDPAALGAAADALRAALTEAGAREILETPPEA